MRGLGSRIPINSATRSKFIEVAGTSPAMTFHRGHLIACGLSGEPVPPVMISGAPQKKNS
jgi:hypothetical protein